MSEVSRNRIVLLRGMYLVNLAFLGSGVWPELAGLHRTQEPVAAVTVCFWAALAALAAVGVRQPVAMLPLLFLQLTYKAIWLGAYALPLAFAGPPRDLSFGSIDLAVVFVGGFLADVIVIPWRYAVARFVAERGLPWRAPRPQPAGSSTTFETPSSRASNIR